MLIASGAVVEQVFSLRGVGSYLLAAITAADTNAVSACMLVDRCALSHLRDVGRAAAARALPLA